MEAFCKHLPKVELHAHLNGSLSPHTLKQLGCFDESVSEYQKLNTATERDSTTLNKCFHLFKVAHNATKSKNSIYLAVTSVIEEFYEDNVVYLELRTTPRAEPGFTKQVYIESIIKAINDNRNNIIVKLLLSIDRRHDKRTCNDTLDLIIKMRQSYPDVIKGIDLCGNPNEGIFDVDLFRKAKQHGLLLSLHCAETKNDEEVMKMFNLRPHRIGHGTCIHPNYGGSVELWRKYCQLKIPVECCLTSNVICGTSKSFEEHHVNEWIKNHLPFSIGTDDKGVFATTLSREYFLAHQNFRLDRANLWKISYDSINQSFASVEEKAELKNLLHDWKIANSSSF